MDSSKLSIDGPTSDIDFYSSDNHKFACHMMVFERLLNFEKISTDSEKKQKLQNIFLQFNSDAVRFILQNSYNIFNGDNFELNLSCINFYHVLRLLYCIESEFDCSEQFKEMKKIVIKQLIIIDKEWYKIFHNDRFNHECFTELRNQYLTTYYEDNDILKLSEEDITKMPSNETKVFMVRIKCQKRKQQYKKKILGERSQAKRKHERYKAYINKLENAIQRTNNRANLLTTKDQHVGWGHYYNFYTSSSVNKLRESVRRCNLIMEEKKEYLQYLSLQE